MKDLPNSPEDKEIEIVAERPAPNGSSSSEAYQKLTSNLRHILVPFGWTRTITAPNQSLPHHRVFYRSPSGRTLRRLDEAVTYLQDINSCHCYLDTGLRFDEVFSFDVGVGGLALPLTIQTTRCLNWFVTKSSEEVLAIKQFLLTQTNGDLLAGLYYQRQPLQDGPLNYHMAYELAHSGVMPLSFGPIRSQFTSLNPIALMNGYGDNLPKVYDAQLRQRFSYSNHFFCFKGIYFGTDC